MDQVQAVASAVHDYFRLMYEAEDSLFPRVFHDASIVHGMRDGRLAVWSAAEFREMMRSRPSPASMQSPRDEAILRIECGSHDLASSKVRVRIGQVCFVDDLTYHRIDGQWLITSKAFHIAQVFPQGC